MLRHMAMGSEGESAHANEPGRRLSCRPMIRLAARLPALCLVLVLLQACQPKPEAPRPAAAASAAPVPAGAADDQAASLMAEAFPGWTAKAPHPTRVPLGEAGARKTVTVLLAPALVAALDADHRMLVVSGPAADGKGGALVSHANGANVGVYGFERRDGRWFKSFEQPSLGWTGFYGEAGTLKAHALGSGRVALSAENGSCWQGTCGDWLQVYALSLNEASPVASLAMGSSSTGATVGCEEWLKGRPLAAGEAMPITADNCFSVSSRWRFEPKAGDSGWPDLVVDFSGGEAVEGDKPDQPKPRVVDEQLVLRHDGSAYKTLSGRNPVRGF